MVIIAGSIIVALYRVVHAKRVEEWFGLAQATVLAMCIAVMAVLSLRLANRFSMKWVRPWCPRTTVLRCKPFHYRQTRNFAKSRYYH